jgi:hypothetical protein
MWGKFQSMRDTDCLVTFGDSWPAGAGLKPVRPYGQLLSDRLQIKNCYNKAIPGSSVGSLLLQLFDYIAQHKNVENHIAIFFITTSGRSLWINHTNKAIHINMSSTQNTKKNIDTMNLSEIYYKYFFSTPMSQFDLTRNILALHQVCNKMQIQDFYIPGWIDENFDFVGIDKEKIYPKTCVQILGYANQDEFLKDTNSQYTNQYMQPCGHPTQQGHQLIADSLHNWIKDKIV